jgi:Flp pilus assembly secretin CpaC
MLKLSFGLCIAIVLSCRLAAADEAAISACHSKCSKSDAGAAVAAPQPSAHAQDDTNAAIDKADCCAAKSADKDAQLEEKLREAQQLRHEIQQLRTELGMSQQILIRVEMLEVSLTELRKMGVDIAKLQKASVVADSAAGVPEVAANGLSGFIDWLEQTNVAKVLARPTVVTVSGRPASVFKGTETPVPAGPNSNDRVNFLKFGTQLDVLATALDDNQVRMEIRASVSEPDDARSIMLDGALVPALKVRQCDTAVETTSGKPVVFTGLVDTKTHTEKQLPDGKIVDVATDTILLIVATPELVAPVTASRPASHEAVRE